MYICGYAYSDTYVYIFLFLPQHMNANLATISVLVLRHKEKEKMLVVFLQCISVMDMKTVMMEVTNWDVMVSRYSLIVQ